MLRLLTVGLPRAGGVGGAAPENRTRNARSISRLRLATWVGSALCSLLLVEQGGVGLLQRCVPYVWVQLGNLHSQTFQQSLKHLLLLIDPGVMLIGLILNWEKPIFQTPGTKPVKPQLGCSQGRCKWVWSNYQAAADRRVPVFSARAGDFETRPPSSCQLGSPFALQRLPRMAFPPRWQLSAVCCTWTT